MKPHSRLAALVLAAATSYAAGPVYIHETPASLTLGNDFLERTISTTTPIGTTQFLNKLTGRTYAVHGEEFELRLIAERVGYSFGSENPVRITVAGMRVTGKDLQDAAGGKRVTLHLTRGGRGPEIDLTYELKPDDFYTRQWLKLRKPAQSSYFVDSASVFKNAWGLASFSLGGYGQPLFADDLFFGLEYPTGISRAENGVVDLGGRVGINVPDDGYTTESAVIGVAPSGLVHRQFLDYVDRIRAARVRPYLLYNTWYDLQRLAMNHSNTLERVPALQKLIQPYSLHLDSFVLDDGWDDMQHLWTIDQARFPGGFRDLNNALQGIGSGLGIWFGPIGGYDQRQVRIATGRREGMEVTSNGQYLCIAGRNYSRLLSDTMLRYQKEYAINYFKLDGVPFGCNEPDHGHPTGVYVDEADARSFISMLEKLRAQDPKVFLNVTTSIWLSPWWLRWADTVWMGGADSGYLPSVPTLARRQSAVSYRDSVLYNDFVTHQAQFPISSLMTHGIIKGKYNMLGGNKEFLDDFKDEVVHYYGVGNMMYEWYLSPDILSPEEIDALGVTTKWAEANAHPLLDNSTMVLGDPAQREPYGYVHSSVAKSIMLLRNPFVRPRTVRLKIDESQGFVKTDAALSTEIVYPYREQRRGSVHFGDTLTFDLGAYEQIMVELRSDAPGAPKVEGVRYSVNKGAVRTFQPSGAPIAWTAPAIRIDGAAGQERTIQSAITVEVPADYREARLAFLLEPDRDIRDVKAEALDNGKPASLALENGGRGAWHWFYTSLPAGKHELALTFHVPSSPGEIHFSGWLLTERALTARDLRVPAPPGDALPSSSDIQRETQPLVDATIH
ncbi:MAG TPA: hypothetical protein VKB88_34740 [Bryobacteraceae bacterium]|nr:hypothetical protein [Bryobacteraceae bacterium]